MLLYAPGIMPPPGMAGTVLCGNPRVDIPGSTPTACGTTPCAAGPVGCRPPAIPLSGNGTFPEGALLGLEYIVFLQFLPQGPLCPFTEAPHLEHFLLFPGIEVLGVVSKKIIWRLTTPSLLKLLYLSSLSQTDH